MTQVSRVVPKPKEGDVAAAKRPELVRLGGKGLLAVADQGLIAGSNFLLNVFLARILPTGEYGTYALAFSIFLLLATSFQALLLSPSPVLSVTVYASRRELYLGSMLRFTLLASALLSGVFGIAAAFCARRYPQAGLAPAFAGLAVSTPCVLLFWLARAACYLDLEPGKSAMGALAYCGLLTGSLWALGETQLNVFTAFLVTALTSLVVGLLLLRSLRPDLRRGPAAIPLAELWRESWVLGRWELSTSLVTWVTSNLCYPFSTAALGASYTGALRALQNLTLPFLHGFGAALRLAVPYASRQYQSEGRGAVARTVYAMLGLAVAAALSYMGLMAVLGAWPMQALYGGKFNHLTPLIPVVLLSALFGCAAEAVGVGLRSMSNARGLFLAYLVAAAVYAVAGYPIARTYGFAGVVASLPVVNLIALAIALLLFQRSEERPA